MNTRTRWIFIVGLTLVLTTLLLIPMTEAKRERKSVARGDQSGRIPDGINGTGKASSVNLARTKGGVASWKLAPTSLQEGGLKPVVSQAVVFGVSQPVSQLPPPAEAGPRAEGREVNEQNEDLE